MCAHSVGVVGTWLTLPIGWRYSAVICQRLVSPLVRRVLRGLRAVGATYMDDVLVTGVGRDRVTVAVRRVGRTLRRAGFLVSAKSVVELVRVIDFIGKKFDSTAQSSEIRPGLMGSVVALWLLGLVHNCLSERMAARLLGKLEWAMRPNAGLAPFVSGGQCWKLTDYRDVLGGFRRSLLTVLAFALNPNATCPGLGCLIGLHRGAFSLLTQLKHRSQTRTGSGLCAQEGSGIAIKPQSG